MIRDSTIIMIQEFEPQYTPPSRKTITTVDLPLMYEAEVSPIKALTQTGKCVALTTDRWASRANHAYTGVTAHFLTKAFDRHHYLLDTKEFPESDTAINVASQLQSILQEWKIDENSITAITTDIVANITSAISTLNWMQVPCFSHTLQLGVEKKS